MLCVVVFFFFQAEDGIRDLVRSRGLGDVYKRQLINLLREALEGKLVERGAAQALELLGHAEGFWNGCLLYTSDAADERSSVDLGGRRIIKKKKNCSVRDARVSIANTRCGGSMSQRHNKIR